MAEVSDSQLARYAFSMMLELDYKTNVLHDYLIFEYAEENVLFWRKAYEFDERAAKLDDSKSSKRKVRSDALHIVDEFLKEDSPYCINIPGHLRESLLDEIGKRHIYKGMFQKAVIEVEKMMSQGPFPRLVGKITTNVEESWAAATKRMSVDEIGKVLFMNWFTEQQDVMPLFSADIKKHGAMLIAVMEGAVGILTDLRRLVPQIVTLGQRHVAYGTKMEHFDSLSTALQVTFKEILGDAFTEDHRVAWGTTFDMICSIMVASMNREREAELIHHASENGSISGSVASTTRLGDMGVPFLLEVEIRTPQFRGAFQHYFKPGHLSLWQAIYMYKRACLRTPAISPEALRTMVQQLYDEYLTEKATVVYVPIPAEARHPIDTMLSDGSRHPDFHLLDAVWAELDEMMSLRPFPRFNEATARSILDSWDFVIAKMGKDMFGKVLFMNLFELVPAVATMFTDVSKHGAMFAEISGMAIHSLSDLKSLIPLLMQTGQRHVSYGIKEEQFDKMGQAVVNTIRGCMKEEFQPEMEEAWLLVFGFLSKIMLRAIETAKEEQRSEAGSTAASATSKSYVGLFRKRMRKGTGENHSKPNTPKSMGRAKSSSFNDDLETDSIDSQKKCTIQ